MPVMSNSKVFVLDNGGYSLKSGFCFNNSPRIVPNCITKAKSEKRRAFIGDEISECRDLSSLFYLLPFQKGYLINWDTQKKIWDYLWNCFSIRDPGEVDLIFTEPHLNFASVREGLNELLFEEYGFNRVLRTPASDLTCYKNKIDNMKELCCLVIDTGYSFTHVVPYVNGKRVREAVRRLDVGGKLLTNHLKEIISYRQLHVLNETYVMNECKEDCCYVALDFEKDMKQSRIKGKDNPIRVDYILPDFTTLRRGVVRQYGDESKEKDDDQQTIRMNNERFAVPEILFNPSDIGIHQMGISEAAVEAVKLCDPEVWPWLFRNIVLTGGSAQFPNMRERIENDIRGLTPEDFDVNVRLPEDPASYAWHGGAALAQDPCFKEISVSKQEYFEKGHSINNDKYYL